MKKFLPILFLALLVACHPDDPVTPTEVSAPTGVKAAYAGNTSLTFTWDETADADYYVGRLELSDGTLVSGGQTTTKETSLTYDDLVSGTAYQFKVRAYTDVDGKKTFGAYSEIVTVTVK